MKLPNVECTNCTLQVIQVMQDTVHGAYNTTPENPEGSREDVYFQCIDLVLKRKPGSSAVDASTAKPTSAADAGVGAGASVDTVDDDDSAVAGDQPLASVHGDHEIDEPSASAGGCALGNTSSTSSAAWLLLALGALVARARKRRS